MREHEQIEWRRMATLELEKATYEANLAERRYAACDPDNRLIAAQLEKSWEHALERVKECKAKLTGGNVMSPAPEVNLDNMADDLQCAWNAPGTTMRTKQRLVRTLIEDIVIDVDENSNEIVLIIHWKGGQHSELRTPKPRPGEHSRRAPDEAIAVITQMSGKWSNEHIAATLNRMGLKTGQDRSWNATRVSSLRTTRGISAYRSSDKDGGWLTMRDAADELNVTHHVIRRLIRDGDLPAVQVVTGAPYQILRTDLHSERVTNALQKRHTPRRRKERSQLPLFSST